MRWADRVDARGLAAFRVLFGATLSIGAIRFLANGWVDRFFVQPDYFIPYWGFEWVEPLGPTGMVAAFVAMAILGVMVSVGFLYRFAIVAFALLFTYVELIDATNYLNHYYFVSLVAVVMAFLPANAMWSVDASLRPSVRSHVVGAWTYAWLRFQVAVVWLSAALAKVSTDWLVHAQPLNIWLNARVDTPLVGHLFQHWEVALFMSWAGFLYDASIPFLLMWRRTRWLAFAAVLTFHFSTHVLFNIGMFPLIMVVSATVFFGGEPREAAAHAPVPSRWLKRFVIAWCIVQVAMPLRFLAYDGNVLWHEQGMRWAFKVLCREKNGSVTFRAVLADGRTVEVPPHRFLTRHQEREMSVQPDMILRLAHHIEDELDAEAVYADAIVSLNGRPPHRLIDPGVDLTEVDDGIGEATWILDGPKEPPPRLTVRQGRSR